MLLGQPWNQNMAAKWISAATQNNVFLHVMIVELEDFIDTLFTVDIVWALWLCKFTWYIPRFKTDFNNLKKSKNEAIYYWIKHCVV